MQHPEQPSDNVLYKALDALYLRGWQDRNNGRDYDPRGTTQWQDVLDLFQLRNQQFEDGDGCDLNAERP